MAYTGDNTKAHDTCFKDFFGRREFALDFIKYYIPKEIKDHVDLSTIEVSIAGFVSEEHKEFYSDVVATLYFLNSTQQLVIYFLFEHKSYPDKFAKLQILNYMVQKWLDLKKNHDSIQYLPIIIPVVIYHGTGKWNIGLDFADYFDLPNESLGKVERSQEMLISAIQNKFGIIKPILAAKIRSIQSIETLDSLFNQVFSVSDTKEFNKLVDEVLTDSE